MIRILLAEDHALVSDSLALCLEAETDLRIVAVAGSWPQAVAMARSSHPDVVVMDVAMPKPGATAEIRGTEGIEATRQIRQDHRTTHVVLVSIYMFARWILSAREAGASAYLSKDTSAAKLGQVIRRVRQGERFFPKIGEVPELTQRQIEVLRQMAGGKTNREIAPAVGIRLATVKNHIEDIFVALAVNDRMAAVNEGRRLGFLGLDDY